MIVLTFEARARLGYAILVTLLAGWAGFTISRLEELANQQVTDIRAHELEITLVERLRFNTEAIISSGRAYLFSGAPENLAEVQARALSFEENFRSLQAGTLGVLSPELVADVQLTARNFQRVQEKLLAERKTATDTASLRLRFDTKLAPLGNSLSRSLERLVAYKEAALNDSYSQARMDRIRIERQTYVLLGLLVLAGLGIGWFFTRLLGRSYHEQEAAYEAARKAVSARDDLLGVVAHDLRNPLGAITARAAMLRDAAETERTRKQAEAIENVGKRMVYLINTMLDAATIEAARFAVTTAPCGVDGVLREALEMFEAVAGSKKITLEQKVREQGLMIMADRERVIQVLSNLLGNALKFTPTGGRVEVAVDRQGPMTRFGVFDTGSGISRENAAHIFERFWKDDASGKHGTGLGLWIARNIIDAHGGRIWVDSEPGHGARFFFTLPSVESKPREAAGT